MITIEIRSELSAVGLDSVLMIEKFMDSEEMFLKYFKKFFSSSDSVVAELKTAVEAENYDEIISKAHALKGMAGNIGLNGVFVPAKDIVDDLRMEIYISYKQDFEELYAAYNKAKLIAEKL